MIDKIIKNKNPLIYGLILLSFFSLWNYFHLPLELFPDANRVQINVNIPYGHFSKKNFRIISGEKIELSLRGLHQPKVTKLRTIYRTTGVNLRIQFDWNISLEKAKRSVEQILSNHSKEWSQNMLRGVRLWSNREDSGFIQILFYHKTISDKKLYLKLLPIVNLLRERNHSIYKHYFLSPDKKEYLILPKLAEIQNIGITVKSFKQRIKKLLSPNIVGVFKENNSSSTRVIFGDHIDSFKSLKYQTIQINNEFYPLSSLAEIKEVNDNSFIFRKDGNKMLALYIFPSPGKNLANLEQSVRKFLKQNLNRSDLKDTVVDFNLSPGKFIEHAVNDILLEILLSAFLAGGFLLLFYRGNLYFILIEIPLSTLLSFTLMKFFNISVNLISLTGLAVANGLNLDTSVVFLDEYLREKKIKESFKKALPAIIFSFITNLMVFIAPLLSRGSLKALTFDLCLSIIFSQVMGILVASFFALLIRPQVKGTALRPIALKMRNWYENILLKIMTFKLISLSIIISLVLFSISMHYYRPLNFQLIKSPATPWIYFPIFVSNSISSEEIDNIALKLQKNIYLKMPKDFDRINIQINSTKFGMLLLKMKDISKEKELIKKLKDNFLKSDEYITQNITLWSPTQFNYQLPPKYQVKIIGENSNKIIHYAKKISNISHKKVKFNPVTPLGMSIQKNLIFDSSLSYYQEEDIRLLQEGEIIGHLGPRSTEVIFGKETMTYSDLLGLPLKREGLFGALSHNILNKKIVKAPQAIEYDASGMLVRLNVKTTFNKADLQKFIGTKIPSKNFHLISVRQEDLPSWTEIISLILGPMLLMSFIFFLRFNSYKWTLLTFASPLLSLVISPTVLIFFDIPFTIHSALGLIFVAGLSFNSTIVFIERLRKSNKSIYIVAKERFIPITVTTMTSFLGILPLAIGFGAAGEVMRPAGFIICYGIIISYFSSLTLLPLLWHFFFKGLKKDKTEKSMRSSVTFVIVLLSFFFSLNDKAYASLFIKSIDKLVAQDYEYVTSHLRVKAKKSDLHSSIESNLPRYTFELQKDNNGEYKKTLKHKISLNVFNGFKNYNNIQEKKYRLKEEENGQLLAEISKGHFYAQKILELIKLNICYLKYNKYLKEMSFIVKKIEKNKNEGSIRISDYFMVKNVFQKSQSDYIKNKTTQEMVKTHFPVSILRLKSFPSMIREEKKYQVHPRDQLYRLMIKKNDFVFKKEFHSFLPKVDLLYFAESKIKKNDYTTMIKLSWSLGGSGNINKSVEKYYQKKIVELEHLYWKQKNLNTKKQYKKIVDEKLKSLAIFLSLKNSAHSLKEQIKKEWKKGIRSNIDLFYAMHQEFLQETDVINAKYELLSVYGKMCESKGLNIKECLK